MKTLPENPNLDHLRKQAKDLLAGLRDCDSRASLADAQASLAEQYGFRTWTDLKAEVDRQRGQAEVADPAIAREIAARFGLGDVTGPMRSVSRPDAAGRRWLLVTDRGDWAPRTVDDVYPGTRERAATRVGAVRSSSQLGGQPQWRDQRGGRTSHPRGLPAACRFPPALSLDTFRGAAMGLQNYVAGQVSWALDSARTDDEQYADRSVRHLLTHLPSAAAYERVLEAAVALT